MYEAEGQTDQGWITLTLDIVTVCYLYAQSQRFNLYRMKEDGWYITLIFDSLYYEHRDNDLFIENIACRPSTNFKYMYSLKAV